MFIKNLPIKVANSQYVTLSRLIVYSSPALLSDDSSAINGNLCLQCHNKHFGVQSIGRNKPVLACCIVIKLRVFDS